MGHTMDGQGYCACCRPELPPVNLAKPEDGEVLSYDDLAELSVILKLRIQELQRYQDAEFTDHFKDGLARSEKLYAKVTRFLAHHSPGKGLSAAPF